MGYLIRGCLDFGLFPQMKVIWQCFFSAFKETLLFYFLKFDLSQRQKLMEFHKFSEVAFFHPLISNLKKDHLDKNSELTEFIGIYSILALV